MARKIKCYRLTSFLKVFVIISIILVSFVENSQAVDLVLKKKGTEDVYLEYKGNPLFAFAPTGDSDLGRPSDSALDLVDWADWCKSYGMNHLRTMVPLAFGRVQNWYKEAGRLPVYHFKGLPGSFDLEQFNQPAWDLIDNQVRKLRDRGIIIQLSLFSGLELRPENEWNQWGYHYFNPKNNRNNYTDSLKADSKNNSSFIDLAIEKRNSGDNRLLDAQKRFVRKVLDHSAKYGNLIIDIGHELGVVGGTNSLWSYYTDDWLSEMINTVRTWESENHIKLLLTLDPVYLGNNSWVFNHPELDLILWGKPHIPEHIISWRNQYKKPYIPDEAWDENSQKYYFDNGESHYTSAMRYVLKMMTRKVQTVNIYQGWDILGKYRGMNFQNYAKRIRFVWNLISDYPNMKTVENNNKCSKIASAPGGKEHMLESEKEVLVYLETGSGVDYNNKTISSGILRLRNLSMSDGEVRYTIYRPKTGSKSTGKKNVSGGRISFSLPETEESIVVFFSKNNTRG